MRLLRCRTASLYIALSRLNFPVNGMTKVGTEWTACMLHSRGAHTKKRTDSPKAVQESGKHKSVLEQVLIKEHGKPMTAAEKVAEKAENTFLYFVVAAAVASLGVLGYILGEQFFASDSPQKVFSSALALIRADDQCEEMFGSPIAGFGEETSRGRRRHVASQKYQKDGHERLRVMFHVKGSRGEGIAQAEKEKRDDGSWEWRFLLVQTSGLSPRTHVLIDNRV